MDFPTAVMTGLGRKYATFTGRAGRAEFWFFTLFMVLALTVAKVVDVGWGMPGGQGPVSGIVGILTLVPALAVSVRRLHDVGRSGWWGLLYLVPLIGVVVLLIWTIRRGDADDNRFGPAPPAPQTVP